MANSRPGHSQIGLCNLGTLATTPADPIAAGIRGAAEMKRSNYKPIGDYLNRKWRNMTNFNVTWESYQSTMFAISKMMAWINLNCDAQILTNIQAAGGNPDVYKFIGARAPGLDWELMISSEKRMLKPTIEVALPYTDAQAFVDGADSDTAIALTGITGSGQDEAFFRRPYFVAFEAPQATALLSRNEIASRSYSFKTKGKKSEEDNTSIVDYIACELTIGFRDASVAEQVIIMAKDNAPSIKLKEMNVGAFYDQFLFPAGVLTLDDEYTNKDDERIQTLKFVGDVFIHDISFDFGAAYGGGISDGGTDGGTMNFG
jgi:hypothetical protein